MVSNFIYGAWPLICSKIGLVNKKSHQELIKEIKGIIEETEAPRPNTIMTNENITILSASSASVSENNDNDNK